MHRLSCHGLCEIRGFSLSSTCFYIIMSGSLHTECITQNVSLLISRNNHCCQSSVHEIITESCQSSVHQIITESCQVSVHQIITESCQSSVHEIIINQTSACDFVILLQDFNSPYSMVLWRNSQHPRNNPTGLFLLASILHCGYVTRELSIPSSNMYSLRQVFAIIIC